MAVNYSSSLKTNRLNLVVNAIATATAPTITTTGGTAGTIVIGNASTAGGSITTTLATINLATTPATVSGNTLTISGVPLSATAAATGTANSAKITNNAGTTIVDGLTVGTTGTDIIISSTSITSGQTVTLTSGVITHG